MLPDRIPRRCLSVFPLRTAVVLLEGWDEGAPARRPPAGGGRARGGGGWRCRGGPRAAELIPGDDPRSAGDDDDERRPSGGVGFADGSRATRRRGADTAVTGRGDPSAGMSGSEWDGRRTCGTGSTSPDDIRRTTTDTTSRGCPVLNDAGRLSTWNSHTHRLLTIVVTRNSSSSSMNEMNEWNESAVI